jgi:putative hydrolase of the HAD superfamily
MAFVTQSACDPIADCAPNRHCRLSVCYAGAPREGFMIEALLFDIDGVLIWHENWFASILSKDKYYDAENIMTEYHRGEINKDCDKGLKDPIEEIKPFLKRIKWDYEAKDYLDMKFGYESQFIDYDMLAEIKKVKRTGIKVFVGSNQNHYRKAFLKRAMNIDEIFDDSYFSCDFGYVKPEKEYWDNVQERIYGKFGEMIPSKILFLDDMQCNIDSANNYGYQTKHVKKREDLISIISKVRA